MSQAPIDSSDLARAGALPSDPSERARIVSLSRGPRSLPLSGADAVMAEWAMPLPAVTPTGIGALDRQQRGGLRADSAYVLVAPPGKHKTGFAIQVGRHIARKRSVVHLSELPPRQVWARFAAQVVRKPWLELSEGREEPVREAVRDLRLRVSEIPRDLDIVRLLDEIERVDGEPPFLILDYLQYVARRLRPDDIRLEVASVSDYIARWTRERHSTALIVSSCARLQYNIEGRAAADFLGAGKESGDIEFDAAGVLFLEVEEMPLGGSAPARLHIAKARYATTGTIGFRVEGATGIFTQDDSASLPLELQEALDCIRDGATSIEDLRERLGVAKATAAALVRKLETRRLITTRPLRLTHGA